MQRGRGRGRGRGGYRGRNRQDFTGGGARGRGGAPDGEGRHARAQQYKRRVQCLTFEEIKRIASASPKDAVKEVNEKESAVIAAYNYGPNCTHPLVLKHLVRILYNLLKSDEDELATRIIGQVLEYPVFSTALRRMLMQMPTEARPHIVQENLHYLTEVGIFAIVRVPKTAVYSFPKLQLEDSVKRLVQKGQPLDNLKRQVEEFNMLYDQHMDLVLSSQIPTPKQNVNEVTCQMEEPPEDFRTISISPEADEINKAIKPFLRPNVIHGGYRDWDHYLDVQFRLLREDFVGPLRSGILGYLDGIRDRKLTDVRVYERIHVLQPVCLQNGVGFQISFDNSRLQRVQWEHSKRLIFGSLLCLSRNEDFKEIVFATVMKREADLLRKGLVTIKFEGDINGFEFDPQEEFVMVESSAYFEAYRHVLEGLQQIKTEFMPLKDYIVSCNLADVHLPCYIRAHANTRLDVGAALGLKKCASVDVTDLQTWPRLSATQLDESQLKAMQTALSKEISVIQGPPGTGKTYIGLKIIQVLLQNRSVWDQTTKSPILVVCYTNHALDQFLEGIMESNTGEEKKPKMIRIGGRCKSEKLSQYILYTHVHDYRSRRAFPSRMHREFVGSKNIMSECKFKIEDAMKELSASQNKVLNLYNFESVLVIDPHHALQIRDGQSQQVGKEMEIWLGIWFPTVAQSADAQSADDLAVAMQQSLDFTTDAESDDSDQFVDVDEEAKLLQEDRMLAGEEIEFLPHAPPQPDSDPAEEVVVPLTNDPNGWRVVQMPRWKRDGRIKRGMNQVPMSQTEAESVQDVHSLSEQDKWRLYLYWLNSYLRKKKALVSDKAATYNAACKVFNEVRDEMNEYVIHDADIVGVTTTGAAKHHSLLKEIHPRIVIIEEAAEVFESHVITSLSPSVQQLVLIGDHKQLKPKPNYHELVKKYSFDVSLFERLANNKIFVATLQVQHRMRPEIAELVCPHIYPQLFNAESVRDYENVKGVGKNLFFINHSFPETETSDTLSHSNTHEANFMVSLCRYLMNQGYESSRITMLTMYRGQLIQMKRKMHRAEFAGVRVAAVDDFQGEENDIVLLSLVRSNSDGNIGFLSIENRVCVSLSRARMGLYVIGNLGMLRNKDATVWPRILNDMDKSHCIGDALPLYCQIHPLEKVEVRRDTDFSKCPEGGCLKKCNARLACGHQCTRLCHPYDRDHKNFECIKDCSKRLKCGHICTRRCHQCAKKCMPCLFEVERTLPKCGHVVKLPCSADPDKFNCTQPCDRKLSNCGHQCQNLCFQTCTIQCMVDVSKKLSCGHVAEFKCYFSQEENPLCDQPCKDLLQCGHECSGTCGSCRQGRLHVQCQHDCGRSLVCGHTCCFPCTANCPPCTQQCDNFCNHSKCPKKCFDRCDPCMEKCEWQCKHYQCYMKCGDMCNRRRCDHACRQRLKCGHPCIGLCGEKCPKECRECNSEDVCEIFFGTEDEPDARFIELTDCGHLFEVTGLDQWMDKANEGSNAVQFKVCPKCKVPVRRSLRYGNVVKQTLKDMDDIKKKQQISRAELQMTLRKVSRAASKSPNFYKIEKELKSLEDIINPVTEHAPPIFPNQAHLHENQLRIISQVLKAYDCLQKVEKDSISFGRHSIRIADIKYGLKNLQRYVMRQRFIFEQQLSDIQSELRRLTCTSMLCELQFKSQRIKCNVEHADQQKLNELAISCSESGRDASTKMSAEREKEVEDFATCFITRYKVGELTKAERIEIVRAIGLAKGHWFKCPKGHFYCIGDCGGATEKSKCPECGATIGGLNHTLAEGNQLAGEMDGAHHAAWSDFTNLANYDPQQFI